MCIISQLITQIPHLHIYYFQSWVAVELVSVWMVETVVTVQQLVVVVVGVVTELDTVVMVGRWE